MKKILGQAIAILTTKTMMKERGIRKRGKLLAARRIRMMRAKVRAIKNLNRFW